MAYFTTLSFKWFPAIFLFFFVQLSQSIGSSVFNEDPSEEDNFPPIEHHLPSDSNSGTVSIAPNSGTGDPTLTVNGGATRLTQIPNTIEDDQARCGADLWAISRNISGGLGVISELGDLICTTLSQSTFIPPKSRESLIVAAAVFTWLTPVFAAAAAGAHTQVGSYKKQGAELAREYNEARGLADHTTDKNVDLEKSV